MRITILANNDLPSNFALNRLCNSLGAHELTIFLSSRVGSKDKRPGGLQTLQFFEQTLYSELLFPLLHAVKQSAAVDQDSIGQGLLSFDQLAIKIRRPISILNGVNNGEGLEILRQSKPELILTLRYGVILRAAVIEIPRWGVINLHSGLLPAYKGVMATFRAMAAGEETIGTTLHYIADATIDTGPVIAETRFRVDATKSYLWHVLNLYPQACDLISTTIQEIAENGSVHASAQKQGGEYFSFPTEDDIKSFENAGWRLFDVNEVLEFASQYLPPPIRPAVKS